MNSLTPLCDIMQHLKIEPKGVVHIGAHEAQELFIYQSCGFKRIKLVEPNPEIAKWLRDRGLDVDECAVGAKSGKATLYITAWDQQSSVKKPIRYETVNTVTVKCKTLDELDTRDCNVLVLDVQGAELDVICSGSLNDFDMIVVEVTKRQHAARYANQPTSSEIVAACNQRGFQLVHQLAHLVSTIVDYVMVRAN